MRTLTAVLLLVLSACGGVAEEAVAEAEATVKPLASSDGSVSVEIPDGWTASEDELPESIAVAAQGEDPLDQLVVTTFETSEEAEDQAVATAAGLASSDISCERTELSDRLVFDCPQEIDGETVRRLFFPVEGEQTGALLLVQTTGESLKEAGELAEPIVASLHLP